MDEKEMMKCLTVAKKKEITKLFNAHYESAFREEVLFRAKNLAVKEARAFVKDPAVREHLKKLFKKKIEARLDSMIDELMRDIHLIV